MVNQFAVGWSHDVTREFGIASTLQLFKRLWIDSSVAFYAETVFLF
jgi:hypothetical protein